MPASEVLKSAPAKVTVAIPTYNRKDYLAESLDSIFKQTFQDFKVIVFDNHSDYDVAAFLSRWPAGRVSLVPAETNTGHLGNMEKIFKYKFDSEYVIVFHDDNTMHPKLLELAAAVLDANPDVSYVGTGLAFAHDGADMLKFDELGEKPEPVFLDRAGLVRLILHNFHLSFDTTLYRVARLQDMGNFVRSYSKWYDRPYLISVAQKGRVAVLKERMENLRQHPGQSSNTPSAEEADKFFGLWSFLRVNLPHPVSPEDNRLFSSWATNHTVFSATNFAKNFREYRQWIKVFREKGFFDYRYLNLRGAWYFLKVIKKYATT